MERKFQDGINQKGLLNTRVPLTFKRTDAGILSLRKLAVQTSAICVTLLKCHIITPDNDWWCILSWLEKRNKMTRLRRDLFIVLVRGEIWKPSQRTQANLCSEIRVKKRGKGCWDKEIFVFPLAGADGMEHFTAHNKPFYCTRAWHKQMCLFWSNVVFPGVWGEDPYMDVISVWRGKHEECQASPRW